ncbi:MAG TPA: N-acetylmuramoyl-L-alanine amidase-like domain-containing protein [Armatimonadota bacterium]
MESYRLLLLPLAVLFLGMVIPAHAAVAMPRQNPACFTAAQWTATFTLAAQLPLSERIGLWADLLAVDSVYKADPLGEGPGAAPDPDPLCDFAHVDCVTYVEQVYALALSANRDGFDGLLQRIRYREGQINYRWRNHYTVADWLPANAWCISDITEEVGAGHLRSMTKTISRKTFFAGKGLTQYADIPDEVFTTQYLPRADAAAATGKLKTGDLIIFLISTPGIEAGHVGLIRIKGNTAYLQHASLTAKHVVTVPLESYLKDMPDRFLGFKIARPTGTADVSPAPSNPPQK